MKFAFFAKKLKCLSGLLFPVNIVAKKGKVVTSEC